MNLVTRFKTAWELTQSELKEKKKTFDELYAQSPYYAKEGLKADELLITLLQVPITYFSNLLRRD